MGLFGFFKPKDNGKQLLMDLMVHSADMIQKNEGRSRKDAEYLAISLIIDDLSRQSNGPKGYQKMMSILQTDFPAHFNDVITYVGWSTGKLQLNPQAEQALRNRHMK